MYIRILYFLFKNAKVQTLMAASAPVLSGDVKPVENPIQTSSSNENINDILKKLINQAPVMLFMKGNAENPQCGTIAKSQTRLYNFQPFKYLLNVVSGFSRQAVALLKDLKAEFGTFDIFSNEKVRQELKTYSNWPTYPQVIFVCQDY